MTLLGQLKTERHIFLSCVIPKAWERGRGGRMSGGETEIYCGWSGGGRGNGGGERDGTRSVDEWK